MVKSSSDNTRNEYSQRMKKRPHENTAANQVLDLTITIALSLPVTWNS